ncbi:hypothetical protein [Microbulbifer sp. VAAF005]|uniref:hypothetical protein n=1 Tax=Microbulbifer sp. VAAF005 TaxID=3034230 RepID=UPI0024AE7CED|nr:hypothetical protein [Microbulbifer sp. VAAF005]WHI46520.1 hypothetical protein P0078_22895 [Microbulbifer sp. VAAF005]
MKIICRFFLVAVIVSVSFAGSIHKDVVYASAFEGGKTLSQEALTAESGTSGTMVDNVGYIIGAIIKALLGEE